MTHDCASMTVELPPEAVTDVGKAATIPVEKDTTTVIGEHGRVHKCRAAPNVAMQIRPLARDPSARLQDGQMSDDDG